MNNVISNQFSFFDYNDKLIHNVSHINIDENGKFSNLVYIDSGDEKVLTPLEYTFSNLVLDIPGLGYARCGDIVTLERHREKTCRYKLQFGWHKNISGQEIFSWYLLNENDSESVCKTLYYEDLCNILAVEHITSGIIPDIQEG